MRKVGRLYRGVEAKASVVGRAVAAVMLIDMVNTFPTFREGVSAREGSVVKCLNVDSSWIGTSMGSSTETELIVRRQENEKGPPKWQTFTEDSCGFELFRGYSFSKKSHAEQEM
jgi:hypothetical protein